MKLNPRKMQKEFREALDALEEATNHRNVITKFYGHSASLILFTVRSKHWENAVANALTHMRRNTHSAFVAVVYDAVTAELYATIKRTVVGSVEIWEHRQEKIPPTILTDFPEGIV